MFYVKELCAYCQAGAVGFRRCSDQVTIVLMCDECDFVWLRPDRTTLADALFPSMETSQVPGTPYAVGGEGAGWATLAEIEQAGWQAYIYGEQQESVRAW